MGKKKPRMSLFSTFVQQINEHNTKISTSDYHLIDNEYFAAFNTLDDIQQFHSKLTKKQQEEQSITIDDHADLHIEEDNNDMDMKSFAQQFLIDLPEHMTQVTENLNLSGTTSQDIFNTNQPINWSPKVKDNNNVTQSSDNKKRKSTTPIKLNMEINNNKRQRRYIQDLSKSSQFISTSDNNNQNLLDSSPNIFQYLQEETSSNKITYENMNSILSTLSDKQSMNNEATISIELAEPSIIKNEPIESEQLIVETKEEPVELNMISTGSIDFGSSKYSDDLDHYVQNIHLLHKTSSVEESNSMISSRPKRIRKRKKLYIEESELITRSKKVKTPIRKKRPPLPTSQISSTLHLTDAEIEQQFGERLPIIKPEHDDNDNDTQQIVNSQIVFEFESVTNSTQTPLEKARAKLLSALERGHDPDTYLLKIRSREHQIIEVQLAIYSTTDWHPHRTKILAKIEEALRGLRVNWTKIDIHVDNFDIQISTASQVATICPPTNISNTTSSWFLKALSQSGPIIIHIHNRRYPQQRFLIKCSCPECSPISIKDSIDSSLPVIVSVSPASTPTRRLMTPTILNKTQQQTNISLLHNIDTSFFNELIYQWGRTIVISVTQCVLDLALIVSVHASLSNLCVSPNYSKEEYKKKYQQIIDPLKHTSNENDKLLLSKTPTIARVVSINSINNTPSIILSKSPDILNFYNLIKQTKTNIRNANAMRDLITKSFSTSSSPPDQSNIIKAQTLIRPKPTSSSLSLSNTQTTMALLDLKKVNEQNRGLQRRSFQTNRYDKYIRNYLANNETKQQAHCTSFIELKPIMGGSTITKQNIHSFTRENNETIIVRDAQNNELKKVTTIISSNTGLNEIQRTNREITPPLPNNARVIRLSIAKPGLSNVEQQANSISSSTIRLVASPKTNCDTNLSHVIPSVNKGEAVPLVPKQINIIKPLLSSSSIMPAIKLSNPILISNKSQQSSTK
ncbi:unnamed protein product [Rotaria sordida]|uniref:Uncharacterized protein n=1 Tax=Rotaria sordida TaxID=392033 RepID=A0A818JW67_9BILA|nr:unnamed protein product [Rotaria sordida]